MGNLVSCSCSIQGLECFVRAMPGSPEGYYLAFGHARGASLRKGSNKPSCHTNVVPKGNTTIQRHVKIDQEAREHASGYHRDWSDLDKIHGGLALLTHAPH